MGKTNPEESVVTTASVEPNPQIPKNSMLVWRRRVVHNMIHSNRLQPGTLDHALIVFAWLCFSIVPPGKLNPVDDIIPPVKLNPDEGIIPPGKLNPVQ